jgi:hypothetical protein
MLILFVLVIVIMRKDQQKMQIKLKEFEKIEEIKKSLNEIDSNYFEYRPEYKKHILKLSVQYPSYGFDINEITDKSLLPAIEETGRVVINTIQKFKDSDKIKYLVVIEGQASKDGYYKDDHFNNDVLSYLRALNLKKYWISKGIDLDAINNCELIVAGSGEGGEPRELPDEFNKKNQRFLIHIIPKTGEIQ